MNAERLTRLFDVLGLLVSHPEGLRLTTIAETLGLPVSSTHNLLQGMVAANLATTIPGRKYTLGARAVRLAVRTVDSLEVRAIARRHLQNLAEEVGLDVYLAVRTGDRVVYADRIPSNRPVSVDIRLGQPLYLHATAVGKLFAATDEGLGDQTLNGPKPSLTSMTITDSAALAAEFARIRSDGFSISRGEAIEGIEGLAVPVRNPSGSTVAAVHVSALRGSLGRDREIQVLEASSRAAGNIETEMGRSSDIEGEAELPTRVDAADTS